MVAAKGLFRCASLPCKICLTANRRYSAFLLRVGPLCRCPNPRYQNKKWPRGSFIILVAAKGFARHKCLRGNRNDYTTLCLCNLLVVGPGVLIQRYYTKIKTGSCPVWILVAAKGFGPLTKGLWFLCSTTELRRQWDALYQSFLTLQCFYLIFPDAWV